MAVEIERKFLVISDDWRAGGIPALYQQGYLSRDVRSVVRVRITPEQGFITIKGLQVGIQRLEFEYAIPLPDARQLLPLCSGTIIEKHRTRVPFEGHVWEVDEFHGANTGLILAEIELRSEDEKFTIPPWIGDEVSQDRRYHNSQLATHPYLDWQKD